MTPLHKISKSYWDAFYTGMMAVGLDPKERPAFRMKGDSESEMMRCMRHAMNTLRYPPLEAWEAAKARGMEIDVEQWAVLFDAMFPEPIKQRKAALTGNDMAVKARAEEIRLTYRWITLDNGRSVYRKDPKARGPASDLAAPMLVRDQMDELRHPITGQYIDSKSTFREATRRNGGVELGSDVQNAKPTLDQVSSADVGEAIRKVKSGYKPVIGSGGAEGWSEPSG